MMEGDQDCSSGGGGGGGSKKRQAPYICRFTNTVLSWSLEDIFNENLYKVEKIPESFRTVEQYFGSFVYPLLEETRAQLCSGMEGISSAPFAEVVAFQESRPYGKDLYDIKVDYWKNRFSSSGKDPYKTLPGDILLLANAKPEAVSDLQLAQMTWTLVSVTNITDDENDIDTISTYFKVKALKDIQVNDEKKSLFAIFLTSITTNRRIWNSLHMSRNVKILKEVLYTDSMFEEECELCSEQRGSLWDEKFSLNLSSTLNNSQSEAVRACLCSMHCNHKPSVQLIWGPPGTGKTRTVTELLLTLLRMKCRALVCAPTNVAITEVASRVLKLVKKQFRMESGVEIPFNPLGEILLFGNEDRLKVVEEIREIYLDHRIKKLDECCGMLRGWRHCFSSMIELLEECVSQYQIFLENELIKRRENSNECGINEECRNETEDSQQECKSFLEFVRERFNCIAAPLRSCIFIFCTHIPKTYISENNFQNMIALTSLLESFETLLYQENLVSEEIRELFSHPVNEDFSKSFVHKKYLLHQRRSECHTVLRILRDSFKELELPSAMNKDSLKDFCFKRASLIFCTASSSFKLHSVAMEPMNVLVIDEAAQLKESESTIPLQLQGIAHAILIGDECQLPATVRSDVSDEAGFGRSLFERLSSLGHSKHLLNIQYRMHPSISFFPNSYFYHNQILDSPNVKRKSYKKDYLIGPIFGPYSFINIFGSREEFIDSSYRNMVEVCAAMKILQKLYKAWSGSKQDLSIGIVSPYSAQVVAMQEKLGCKYDNSDGFAVKAKSIDGFQGGEEDIIIISTVRSNNAGSIGFVSKPQRINVALTRARHCLWILGNERTLTRSESVWEIIVCDAKERRCFFNADEDKDLAKAILDAKKELDELDELLNAESILFRNQRWKVIFSDNFLKSFKKLTSDRTKKSVINHLLKISSGWRPNKKQIDSFCERSSHIIKQFKVESHYIVCTIDIVKDSQYIQVLKVWDILPLEDVQKLVKRLDDIFVKYTDDYINRCKEKCIEGKLEVPKTWAPSSDIVRLKNFADSESGSDLSGAASDRSYVENSKVTDSLLLMKFYTLSSGVVNHLLSDRDGRELDLPFEVTDEQLEMILFPRSTFIVGRSGTGKTTVLTMKLFQKEKLHYEAMERYYGVDSHINLQTKKKNEDEEGSGQMTRANLCQLFVTVSPKLCFAVKQHVSHLKSFVIGEKFSTKEGLADVDFIDDVAQFKDIPNSFVNFPQKSYPLVITFHKFLMMLDGTLGNSYFDRFHNIRKHYDGQIHNLQSVSLETFIRIKEVSYERFNLLYWPHFNEQLTKKLDSSRVFSEIISHIKGGLRSMELGAGKLSREDYVQLSEGRVSTLTRQKREMIYDIFQNYERMKMENGEFDLADFVIDLHHRLEKESYKGDEIHYVYIDEVQDLTMSQIALFKYICRNVEEGFVFSGDTAQTIARGIDFRFQDIRSLFYKKFVNESRNKEHDGREEKGQVSEIFSLSQNFRTHAGVLDLAQSIIDLLYRFFSHSVDILKPETSLIYGEPPILLESRNEENAIIKIFGNSGHVGGSVVGFGAEQVILVRDDSVRIEISNYVGKQALVLTIVESKGLEFQDVLLYNFFCSSSLKNQWRVIYEYMKEQNLLDTTLPKPTSFSEAKHSILCTELKQLYVAITRTRQRLWIWEDREEPSKPMFDYWKKKFLVQARELDDSLAHAMQSASSPEEWKSQGMKLFYEQCYDMATMCFERAKDTYWEERSKATGLKADADRIRSLKPEEANIKLRQAATIFEAIGKADSAANCFYDLREYERAEGLTINELKNSLRGGDDEHSKSKLYLEKCGEPELERAGECFCLAGRYELAAEAYAKGNFFSECLGVCSQGKLFEVGLEYIHCWKQHAKTDDDLAGRSKDINKIEQEFLERCALHFHELKDNTSMMRFVKAFSSMDLKRDLLKSLSCFDELLSLEEESGNFMDAANIAKLIGDFLRVADLLQKAGNFKEASTFLLNHVFSNSLWSFGSKGWPLKQFSQKEEHLERARSLAKYESNQFYELVCTEADILSNDQGNLFMLNQQLNASKRHQSIRGKILSARKILDFHLQSNPSKYGWEDELILDLRTYSEETVCKGQVSVETLVYFWNYWKDEIVNIFEYLEHLQTQDVNNYKSYGDFCLNYLGVWKEYTNVGTNFILLNSDADWARELDKRHARRSGKLVSVNVRQLVSAARSYWSSELLSVGMKVLNNLDSLCQWSSKNSSEFCQAKNLMYIYEVSKFLLNSKFVNHRYHETKALQKFVEQSTEHIFYFIFPLDWRKSLRRNLISLRGTEICESMMKEIICKFTGLGEKLSYGQIGRLVVMILGSSKPNNDLLKRVAKTFGGNTPWQVFVEQLSENVGPGSQQVSGSHDRMSLIQKFHGALKDTYEVNWRKCEYISPGCFLYLIERLLIMLSSIQGYILTTQSSFVDWLIYQEDIGLTSRTMFSVKEYLVDVLKFVVDIVLNSLGNEKDTIEWIRKSYTNVKQSHSLVVLRLVVILCLLHLNFGNHTKLLFDVLGRRNISSQLPKGFCDTLCRRWKRSSLTVNVIAEAFKKIGNPLVVVSVGERCSMFRCPDAIFVDIEASKCKEDILGIMFPKFEASQAHNGAAKACNTHKKVLSPDSHGQGKSSILPSSNSASLPGHDSGPQNINGDDLLMILGPLSRIIEVLNAEDQKSIVSQATTIKVDLEKCIHLLTTAINGYSHKSPFEGEERNRLEEAASMLEELKQLYAALDASVLKVDNNYNISTIGELCKRLQSRRPTMEPLLKRLILQQSTNLKAKTLETGSTSGGQCDEADTDSEVKESSNPDKGKKVMSANVDSGTQGNRPETETKAMGKGKPKKNKKGKGGRKHR